MNVIIANNNKQLLDSLDVDVIKNLEGNYTSDEIIQLFSNFFFNKMFLDITAVNDYKNIVEIQKISKKLPVDKIIFLLNDELLNNQLYISNLINLGIYNFTTNKEGLIYLYNNTNKYEDVSHLCQVVDNIPITDVTGDSMSLNNSNSFDVNNVNVNNKLVIGVQNVTLHAGATTLVYMLKKVLSDYCSVIAIEINKHNFIYFNDKNMISVDDREFKNTINNCSNYDVILIDLNDVGEAYCDDIVYLIEPSTIKLNRMITIERDVFNRLKGKKIVLNQSLLDEDDIKVFGYESNSRIFYNLPPINDKEDLSVLLPLLEKLKIIKQ